MGQLLLKMTFYLVTGVLLSSITWSTLSHSAVTGDYILSVILLGMMFYVAGKFFVDRWRPEDAHQDFHATKLWKIPHTTTRSGLWLRVVFSTAAHISGYTVLASMLVLTTTAHPAFLVLLGALFLLRIPHLYWSMRGKYEQGNSVDGAGASQTILHYVGSSRMNRKARWLVPMGLACAFIIAMFGGACGEENRIEESPLATWDPSESEAFFQAASGEGTLDIASGCVRLIQETDAGQKSILLVWPEPTSWNASSQLIEFVDVWGERLELRDGDKIVAGGAGYPIVELTEEDKATGKFTSFASPPAPSCKADESFVLNSISMAEDWPK